jgi:hypothetical protein
VADVDVAKIDPPALAVSVSSSPARTLSCAANFANMSRLILLYAAFVPVGRIIEVPKHGTLILYRLLCVSTRLPLSP